MGCATADNRANEIPSWTDGMRVSARNIQTEKSEVKKINPALVFSGSLASAFLNIPPEAYIGFQISFISEVKSVFVSRDKDLYCVVIVVDNRDLALNRRIFEQQRAIMHYYRQFVFDFYIVPLMGRNLNDVMTPKGTQVLCGK